MKFGFYFIYAECEFCLMNNLTGSVMQGRDAGNSSYTSNSRDTSISRDTSNNIGARKSREVRKCRDFREVNVSTTAGTTSTERHLQQQVSQQQSWDTAKTRMIASAGTPATAKTPEKAGTKAGEVESNQRAVEAVSVQRAGE
jgi:hypothetical protein